MTPAEEERHRPPDEPEPVFSLYLHVPFCAAKCGYCSFYSRAPGDSAVAAYLRSLENETAWLRAVWGGKLPLRTLYIGGGTPTALDVAAWRRLDGILDGAFRLSGVEEATVEANPCSLTGEHLRFWRDTRVTRVSLGVQSLHDPDLTWLGRRHDAKTALLAVEAALAAEFAVSADLIFGLPPQTLRTWRDSISRLVRQGVSHISVYQLTLEPGTPLGDRGPSLPDGYPFYRFAQWYLPRKGLRQYEIASFAHPGKESRHNRAYWEQENVLALGPSAWGYLDGFRYRNVASLEESLRSPPMIAEGERLSDRARGVEAVILALRTSRGIERDFLTRRFGPLLWDRLLRRVELMPRHFFRLEQGEEGNAVRLALSPAGMRVGNAIWTELLELA